MFTAIMVFYIVLIILCTQGAATSQCNRPCPQDKPYCSEVGCIYACPVPFYINGSDCVSECGEMFVDANRKCISSCPEETFYIETLKQVMSMAYLERKCIRCDRSDQFVSDASCVEVCPAYSRYIDEQRCVSKCPEVRPFKIKAIVFGLLHYKCVGQCPIMEDDGFCQSKCPKNKVVYDNTCLEKCPSTSPFISSKYCLTECPGNAPSAKYDNKTCLQLKCPEERPFVVNKTCVDTCPGGFPFVFSTFNGISGFKYCVKNCVDKYKFNNRCVNTCPLYTVAVNNTCIEQCPWNTPYSCLITKGFSCGERSMGILDHKICLESCPQSMFHWNKTCVYACPNGVPTFGRDCTDICPTDFPYKQEVIKPMNCLYGWCEKVETELTCTKTCSPEQYISNFSCLGYCPLSLYHNGNNCVSRCPVSAPLIKNIKITLNVWSNSGWRYGGRSYHQRREQRTIQKCVTSCGEEMVQLDTTCVTSCPVDYPFIHNGTCSTHNCNTSYSEKTSSGTTCSDECKPRQVILNKTCVEACPNTYVYFNKTCLHHCPESNKYISNTVLQETCFLENYCSGQIIFRNCVEECHKEFFEHNGTCMAFCPTPMYTFGNQCVSSCPTAAPYPEVSSKHVVTWSNNDGNYLIKQDSVEKIVECKATCSGDKVLFGSKCIDMCPLHSRYILNGTCQSHICKAKYKFYSLPGIKCYSMCPQDLFIHNDTCVLQCPDDLYALKQNCVAECPSTHYIINDKAIGKDEYNCTESLCAKSVINVKECSDICPENKFLFNNICSDLCLQNMSIFKNTCVEMCPSSHPFIEPTLISTFLWKTDNSGNLYRKTAYNNVIKCVAQCSSNYVFLFRRSCLKKCPDKEPYSVDGICTEKCPENKLTDTVTKQCVDKCRNDRGLFNKSCHNNCPRNVRYIFESRCVSKCPSSHPVALKEDRFICREYCLDGDKLFKDGKCISNYECSDPMFAYDGLCLDKCPEGFVWFATCQNTLIAKIALAALVLLLFLLFLLSRQQFRDFVEVLRLIFISEITRKRSISAE